MLGVVVYSYNARTRRPRQEPLKFEANLGYLVRLNFEKLDSVFEENWLMVGGLWFHGWSYTHAHMGSTN